DRPPPRFVRLARVRAEHERVLLDERDSGPGAAAVLEERRHDLAQHVVRVAAAAEDPLDRLERADAHPASNASTGSRHSPGTSQGRRSWRSTSTMVWLEIGRASCRE